PAGESVVAWKRARSRSRRGSDDSKPRSVEKSASEEQAQATDFDVDEQRTGRAEVGEVMPRREDVSRSDGDDADEDRLARLKRARRRARGEEDA
ncbi:MAG TPA: hypothetical protein DCX60_08475, partial [Phycisphaerales bacterium]|nr:hypothetical protein [Phycisphaerales bacterium]